MSTINIPATPNGHYLDAPGARLYYEVRGAGPTLLLIGAPMGTEGFAAMADELADRYTVVTYDPRGISRSIVGDDPPGDDTPQVRADDIHRLLNALASGPAHVFGSSGGALTALALLTTYPEQVQTLIAHEPPLVAMLPDHAELVTACEEIRHINRSTGPGAAMLQFLALTGVLDLVEGTVVDPDSFITSPQQRADCFYFLEHMLPSTLRYVPDIIGLQATATSIAVAHGSTSTGQLPHRGAAALANRLRTTAVVFPGDHAGWVAQPRPCADTLRQVLPTA